jgi:hypothetical protein
MRSNYYDNRGIWRAAVEEDIFVVEWGAWFYRYGGGAEVLAVFQFYGISGDVNVLPFSVLSRFFGVRVER